MEPEQDEEQAPDKSAPPAGELDGGLLREVFDRAPETRIQDQPGYCGHHSVLVDRKTRTIKCRACGAVVDPFDRMLEYARNERRFQEWRDEEKNVKKRVAELRDEERKAKQRIRGANKRSVEGALAAERKKRLEDARSILFASGEALRGMKRVRRLMLKMLADEAIETDDRELMRNVLSETRMSELEQSDQEQRILLRFKEAIAKRKAAP